MFSQHRQPQPPYWKRNLIDWLLIKEIHCLFFFLCCFFFFSYEHNNWSFWVTGQGRQPSFNAFHDCKAILLSLVRAGWSRHSSMLITFWRLIHLVPRKHHLLVAIISLHIRCMIYQNKKNIAKFRHWKKLLSLSLNLNSGFTIYNSNRSQNADRPWDCSDVGPGLSVQILRIIIW